MSGMEVVRIDVLAGQIDEIDYKRDRIWQSLSAFNAALLRAHTIK